MMWLTDAEGRQDHDVHFGVAEEPEQVLVEHRIAAARRIEEGRAEVAVGQQHRDRAGENRQRQEQQERGHQHRPGEERHLVQRHARRAHVEDRGDEVDRAEDRGRTGEVQRQDAEVERRAGMAGRSRAADRPSSRRRSRASPERLRRRASRASGRRPRNGEPERDVVHPREGHVGRADHQRHEPVAEAADQRRHHHEEHHDEAVAGHEDVEGLRVGEDTAGRAPAAPGAWRSERRPPTMPAVKPKMR